ncbi:Rqc2 family fibronectin-binding protein [Listeria riparia]|uniref:Rqc2 homolog RqcH n=1 Tax=Listeria riparia FSL S10-1204 TaxID=1265816 RepID=W7DF74_9LIST|nr:NFACT RNA binding domain-containing protein [Listeria riparia]EUJ46121.1 fibronectin/fibrinogen binding protein [Listeria riparia FSL S10-1204]
MAFDTMFLRAMTEELTEQCETGRIMKIHQPFAHELVLHVRKNRENQRILISAHPSYARIQLTKETMENPAQPPMFCMLLRKYMEGAIIESIRQVKNDRILIFGIRGKDEIGETRFCDLYVEIMGRHSNVVLVDREKETIVDCIKHVSPAFNSYRTLLPGAPYVVPPSSEKLDPWTVTEDALLAKLDFNAGKMSKQVVGAVAGFSPLLANEVMARAGMVNRDTLPKAFFSVMADCAKPAVPNLFVKNAKEDFYFMRLTNTEITTELPSLSALLDRFYSGKATRDRVHQIAHDLERLLANELDRDRLKMEKLEQTLVDTERADEFRIFGELLTANLHLVSRGMTEIAVQNFYDEDMGMVTIPLDIRKSPAQNAQFLFNKYQKLKKAVRFVEEQMRLTKEEMGYLETVQQQLEDASPEDVEEIRVELAEQGYIKYKQKKGSRKPNQNPTLEKYISSTGLPILVGKNNKQNDYLTNKFARNSDLWFHVKDLPGSHVVIQDANPDEASILEAAMIAAFYSKARLSGSVPVDATLIKHVKKPSGSKPGYVTYDNQTTYFVTPDEATVKKLRN